MFINQLRYQHKAALQRIYTLTLKSLFHAAKLLKNSHIRKYFCILH